MRNRYKGKKGMRLTPAGKAVIALAGAVLLVLLSYGVIYLFSGGEGDAQSATADTSAPTEATTLPPTGVLYELMPDLTEMGDLILISNDYPISFEVDPDALINIYSSGRQVGFGLRDATMLMPDNVLTPLCEMFGEAKKLGGFNFVLLSTYRSIEEQQALFDELDDEPRVAKAGCSEHNLGIAVDVGRTGGAMEGSVEAEWIRQNSWKYGFVVRYPADKTLVTGITYEPWHIRYVGKTHATLMNEKGYCLEEYLDYLKKQKHVKIRGNSTIPDCDIYYADTATQTEIDLPVAATEISGDNKGGVVFVCPAESD